MRKKLFTLFITLVLLNVAFVWFINVDKSSSSISATQVPQQEQRRQYSVWSPDESEEPDKPEIRREVVPQFIEVPKFRNLDDSIYGDVLSHAPTTDNRGNRSTSVHETAHGIHAYLRNNHSGRNNGFYVLEGRGVIIDEPNMRKSQIGRFVPQNLRSYRYSLYMSGQRAWDDTPLYVYDEWTCYVLGGMTNVDDVQNGRSVERGDGVSGCLGFSIYAIATCMAIKEHDPDYWENNKQFRDFTIWMLRQSEKTFKVGREMDQFKMSQQDVLFNELMANETYEKFVLENLEGVWFENAVVLTSQDYDAAQQVILTKEDAEKEYRRHRP